MHYTVETYGHVRNVELPLVIGVLADLTGCPAEARLPVGERKFMEIDADNFDERLRRLKPRVAFDLPSVLSGQNGGLQVDLEFKSLEDFTPLAIVRRVESLHRLLRKRTELITRARWETELPEARPLIEHLLNDPNLSVALSPELGSDLAGRTAEALANELDRLLTVQVNAILHHPDFQRLEATWRGLHYLVRAIPYSKAVRIRVLDVTKEELGRTLRKYEGAGWTQSPLFRRLHTDEFDMPGGQPFGLLVGDYEFDHSAADVELLRNIGAVAAACHAPFVTGASASLVGLASWGEFGAHGHLARSMQTAEYAAWHALRDQEDSTHVVLTLPRFLVRPPITQQPHDQEGFHFHEDVTTTGTAPFVWANAAYALARTIALAFERHRWWGRIWGLQGGGAVEDLAPCVLDTDPGVSCVKWPVEVIVSDSRAEELAKLGLNALQYHRTLRCGVFSRLVSINRPRQLDSSEATLENQLMADLRHLLSVCRCLHYLKCIMRDNHGLFKTPEDLERCLRDWIQQYVLPKSTGASAESRARFPLAAAEVKVVQVEGTSGSLRCRCRIRPHFQYEDSPAPVSGRTLVPKDVVQAGTDGGQA
jgi:type VI secretion system protein ImpC